MINVPRLLPSLNRPRGLLIGVAAAMLIGASVSLAAEAIGIQARPASAIDLPGPLGRADAERYRMIFAVQEEGLWQVADRQIRKLSDRSLMGHVLAQRYLHPTAYRSPYKELVAWLVLYADHPQASEIHALAMKRKPAAAAAPDDPPAPSNRAGPPENHVVPPTADWLAGLAEWRKGRLAEAAARFELVAANRDNPAWEVAAGAYWAARSHLKDGRPERVSTWLKAAAKHRESFYGQLARRALGMDPGFDFDLQPLAPFEAKSLLATTQGRRALALLQVGRSDAAENELVSLHAKGGAEFDDALATLAQAANMPALSLNLAAFSGERKAAWLDAMRYPVPAWAPTDGFKVDRALLYAFMRHESGFDPGAESPAGAKGLMQLMPDTADTLTAKADDFDGAGERRLLEPEVNLTLGQKYVAKLLAEAAVDGDLIRLVAAYNAGPGKLARWRGEIDTGDPLLFLESMPSLETRTFVRRVLSSLWIYQERLGQEALSLDALAAGDWPAYVPQDGGGPRVAQYGSD